MESLNSLQGLFTVIGIALGLLVLLGVVMIVGEIE